MPYQANLAARQKRETDVPAGPVPVPAARRQPCPRGRPSDPRPYRSRHHGIYTSTAAKFAVISVTADLTVWTNGHQFWCTYHGQRLTWPAADFDEAATRLAALTYPTASSWQTVLSGVRITARNDISCLIFELCVSAVHAPIPPRMCRLALSLQMIMNCPTPTLFISPQTVAFIEMIMVNPAAA